MSTDFGKSFMRVGGVALASVLMASCSQNWSNSSPSASLDDRTNPYAAGKARMAAGQYGLAVQSFRKALAIEPGSVKALNALAATYDLLGRFDLAERYYRQALSVDPNSIQSINNLGYSYYLRGEYGEARKLFERAAGIDAANPVVAANLKSLEAAQMKQQLAEAAKREREARESKVENAPRTAWIERTDSKIQTLVTKSDPDSSQEARIVHTPKPLIEIATKSPPKADTPKQAPAPVMTARISQPAGDSGIEKAAPTELHKKEIPAETDVASLSPKEPTKDDSPKPEPDFAATAPEASAKAESAAAKQTESEAKSDTAMADLPKLNNDAAQDVLAAANDTDGADSAKGAAPVPPPADTSDVAVKPPEKAEESVNTAALPDTGEAVVLDPLDPVQEAEADTSALAVAAPTAPDSAKTETAPEEAEKAPEEALKAPEEAVKTHAEAVKAPGEAVKAPEEKADPVATAALATKSDTPPASSGKETPSAKIDGGEFAAWRKTGRLEISNGAGRLAMAARMGRYLGGHGVEHYNLTNAESYTNMESVLYFKPGHMANAKSLSSLLPVQPDLRSNEELKTDLRLVLGGDLLNFDRDLIDKNK